MKKKQYLSNKKIALISFVIFLVLAGFAAVIFNPNNDTDVSHWFKTNFFPADEFAVSSVLDVESSEVITQEYRGSTSAAWLFCGILSAIVLIIFLLFFARERGIWK